LGLEGGHDQKTALEVLMMAETLALELGLHQRDYANRNGLGSSVQQEILRRSWWELYVVKIMMAGFHEACSTPPHPLQLFLSRARRESL
jgi:hypothetical protein